MINMFWRVFTVSPVVVLAVSVMGSDAVFALADRVSVINYGKIVATGTVDQIKSNELVRDVYLGYEI